MDPNGPHLHENTDTSDPHLGARYRDSCLILKETADIKSFTKQVISQGNAREPRARDHEIMRAQKKVSKGRPKAPPKSCGVVTDPRVQCEVICDQALNQMLFQWISIHAGPHAWSPGGFVLGLPPRGGF